MTAKLKIVTDEQPPIDIYGKWRAEIRAIDWGNTHIMADRRKPVELGEVRRGWR